MKIIFYLLFLLFFLINSCKDNSQITPPDNTPVEEIPHYTDTLYIGGSFKVDNDASINNIAKWDGIKWESLGGGVTGHGVDVECMAFYNGELYVGGFIDSAGGKAVNHIAKWNGIDWTPVGGGINGRVTSLVVYKNELYAGGWFSSAGGFQTDNIAKWDGSNWSAVGEGLADEVYTLAIYRDKLYVGGWFTKGMTGRYFKADKIARWDGTKWDTVGIGIQKNRSGGGYVYRLTVYNNELYAIGDFNESGGLQTPGVAKWNDTTWSALNGGFTPSYSSYAAIEYKNKLMFGGDFSKAGEIYSPYLAIWNGSQWSYAGFWLDGAVRSLFVFNDFLYVGGGFTFVNGIETNRIYKTDGIKIYQFGPGIRGYVSSIIVK